MQPTFDQNRDVFEAEVASLCYFELKLHSDGNVMKRMALLDTTGVAVMTGSGRHFGLIEDVSNSSVVGKDFSMELHTYNFQVAKHEFEFSF